MSDAWLLHITGAGEGCDYTIGCNQRMVVLKTGDEAEIRREIESAFLDGEPPREATLYCVARASNATPLIHKVAEELDERRKDRALQQKRAELERLKRELGE